MGFMMSREGRSVGYLGDIEQKMALLQEIHKHSQPRLERFPELGKASCWSMLLTLDVTALKRILNDLHGPGTKPTVTLKYLLVKGHTSDSPVPRTKESRYETETEQYGGLPHLSVGGLGFHKALLMYLRNILTYIDTGGELLDLLEELEATTPITDSRRNMICLSHSLHTLWRLGRFILVPMGRPSKVKTQWCQQMRFYWTRATDVGGMLADLSLDTDPRTRFKDPLNGIDAYNIKDGQVITVRADCQDDLPDYDILDLHAKLTTAWALTAGVDPREYDRVLDSRPRSDA
ncbi:hypothetical protein CPLU01_11839 [Colletotrichum plurivorum]|uniref:HNH nuclease domain-containing protein n=1 Tax=Colletotrichum plurivorum TaxID=2175906 RepID=A0A8H6K091_9PEZI|nr:hypothetical protein CPLU01_11839 [Colletotrichum plurivorum]